MKVHPATEKLQRLPHVFANVLQLPFRSDTNVSVEETSESFLFTATAVDMNENVHVHAVQICPGATKVVVRRSMGGAGDILLDHEVELDLWRFRLPPSARPEMASARCFAGELVVTVPKTISLDEIRGDNQGGEEGVY